MPAPNSTSGLLTLANRWVSFIWQSRTGLELSSTPIPVEPWSIALNKTTLYWFRTPFQTWQTSSRRWRSGSWRQSGWSQTSCQRRRHFTRSSWPRSGSCALRSLSPSRFFYWMSHKFVTCLCKIDGNKLSLAKVVGHLLEHRPHLKRLLVH